MTLYLPKKEVIEIGKRRQKSANGFSTPRLYKNRNTEDIIGVAGEVAFSRCYGYPLKLVFGKGDGGYDFNTPVGKIDIKTSQFAGRYSHLLVKTRDIRHADIFIRAKYKEIDTFIKITFLGWAFQKEIKDWPTKDFKGLLCYYCDVEEIKNMISFNVFWEQGLKEM